MLQSVLRTPTRETPLTDGASSGRAIFFATVINAGGFHAFASADLPPMRQFGVLSSVALTLSMIAGFTALPAALWIVLRAKPDGDPSASGPLG